jgi:hypothetical protein
MRPKRVHPTLRQNFFISFSTKTFLKVHSGPEPVLISRAATVNKTQTILFS